MGDNKTKTPVVNARLECARLSTKKIVRLTRTKLRMHLMKSSKKISEYCCPVKDCEKTGTKTNVMSHYCNVHLKEKRFMCARCGHSDFYRKNLERHIVTHDEVRVWYQCLECEVRYMRSSDLICKHQKSTGHKGMCEKPFIPEKWLEQ